MAKQTEIRYYRQGSTGGIRRVEIVYDEGVDPENFTVDPPDDSWWEISAEEYTHDFADHEKGREIQAQKDKADNEEKEANLLAQARNAFVGAKAVMGPDAALGIARAIYPKFQQPDEDAEARAEKGWSA